MLSGVAKKVHPQLRPVNGTSNVAYWLFAGGTSLGAFALPSKYNGVRASAGAASRSNQPPYHQRTARGDDIPWMPEKGHTARRPLQLNTVQTWVAVGAETGQQRTDACTLVAKSDMGSSLALISQVVGFPFHDRQGARARV